MLRKTHGVSLSALAGMVGVTPGHLSRVESGERAASPGLDKRITEALAALTEQAS
jgi:transcriptional regulator with XRE-family HTH domain